MNFSYKLKIISIITTLLISNKLEARWQDYSERGVSFKMGGGNGNMPLSISPMPEFSSQLDNLNYKPNIPGQSLYGISYHGYSLTYGSTNKMLPTEIEKKGETKYNDYQFRINRKKMIHNFFYQKYTGYYLENTKQLLQTDDYYLRSDMQTTHLGLHLVYSFNGENYSASTFTDMSARQISSGGSWLGIVSIDHHRLVLENSIVPEGVSGEFGELTYLRDGTFNTLNIGLGYGYTLTKAGFYLSGMFIAGSGPQERILKYTNKDEHKYLVSSRNNLKVGFGYNGENFFVGMQFHSDTNGANFDRTQLNFTTNESSFLFGYRFM